MNWRLWLVFVPVMLLACLMLLAHSLAELARDLDRFASSVADAMVSWAHRQSKQA